MFLKKENYELITTIAVKNDPNLGKTTRNEW